MGYRLVTIDLGRKLRAVALCPCGGVGFPSNTIWLGEAYLRTKYSTLINPAVWPQSTWAEKWGTVPLFGEAGSATNTMWPAEAYLRTKWHLDPFSRLAQTWAEKWGADVPPFWRGGAGSPSNTMSSGPRPTSPSSGVLIHIQPCGYNRHGPTIAGLCPFDGGGDGSPPNTVWPGATPTSMRSVILIHPSVWPQYTNVISRQLGQTYRQTQTDRQTGQTENGPTTQRDPFHKRSPKNTTSVRTRTRIIHREP